MTFVEGFLTPVPTANKDAYKKHAEGAVELFQNLGATRFVEAWGDDVPDGTTNDLKKAVDLKDDETVLFSWLEYPDKATRDEANRKMMEDPDLGNMEMPFDGSRMIFAGFEPIVDVGSSEGATYLDGFVLPVPKANKEAYRDLAQRMTDVFKDFGALRVVEAWSDDTPDGTKTDYNRATLKKDDEAVVYSWIEWPDKATRDTGWEKMMKDERMQRQEESPFDGQRMMWGGFAPILDTKA
jgi:uncharacterized protein YbaA (DUF1428 family)